jgi:hypothetical protein
VFLPHDLHTEFHKNVVIASKVVERGRHNHDDDLISLLLSFREEIRLKSVETERQRRKDALTL